MFLLGYLRPTLHVVLGSRGDPPFRLPAIAPGTSLLVLRADDLAFAADETGVCLSRLLESELARPDVESLHAQLAGWAAGLRLAGLPCPLPP